LYKYMITKNLINFICHHVDSILIVRKHVLSPIPPSQAFLVTHGDRTGYARDNKGLKHGDILFIEHGDISDLSPCCGDNLSPC